MAHCAFRAKHYLPSVRTTRAVNRRIVFKAKLGTDGAAVAVGVKTVVAKGFAGRDSRESGKDNCDEGNEAEKSHDETRD